MGCMEGTRGDCGERGDKKERASERGPIEVARAEAAAAAAAANNETATTEFYVSQVPCEISRNDWLVCFVLSPTFSLFVSVCVCVVIVLCVDANQY